MLIKYLQLCLLAFLLPPMGLIAQEEEPPIYLVNPSFEDVPKCCDAPTGWFNCGKGEETPPDIQPGFFQVSKPASNGQTYVGLVTRDNDTWEAISQRLSRPLEAKKCYEFTIDLCRADYYISLSRTTGEEVNYATPARLRIWGGNSFCDKQELLAETSVIVNTRWLPTNFKFTPKNGNYSFLVFEAYYKTPILFPTNGNVLMDNASPIRPVPCTSKPIAQKEQPIPTKDRPAIKPPTVPTKTNTSTPPKPKEPTPAVTNTSNKMDRSTLKKGDIIRLDKIYFEANKYEITSESVPSLEEVLRFLKENSDVSVEIGGHTNNIPGDAYADQLSTNRAKSVAEWLTQRGIPASRVQYKGYGKKHPIESNVTEKGRKANQRVEIKILSIG